MGAMSRSYRARSGGLANELCLLGREEVPSLNGDMVLLTKLVMLWQLLGREGPGESAGPTRGRRGRAAHSAALRVLEKAGQRLHSGAQPGLPPGFAFLTFLSGNFHRTVSTDRNRRVNQLHTTAYISMEFFCIIRCPKVLFKGFNYILV